MPNSYSNSPDCPKYDFVCVFIFSYFFWCGNSSVMNLFCFNLKQRKQQKYFLYFKKKDKVRDALNIIIWNTIHHFLKNE